MDNKDYHIDHIITRKGKEIDSCEIEREILNCQLVVEVAVMGIPDDTDGEVPVAFIVLKNHELAANMEIQAEIVGHMKRNLSLLKIPSRLIIVPSLDDYKMPNGMILKFKIRESNFYRSEFLKTT